MNEMVAVAWKRPNVYVEIGGISPKYIAKPGTGWEPLLVYGNSVLQDQILFATDSLIPHERAVKEVDMLPLKDEVKEKLLYRNATRVLNLSSLLAKGSVRGWKERGELYYHSTVRASKATTKATRLRGNPTRR